MMIKKSCFQESWIRRKGKEFNADPILVERVIYAFELLGLLIKSDIELVFKGGTSLILTVPGFKRLSIDLDVVIETDNETLKNIFANITNGEPFKRWEEDKRTQTKKIPKGHFKFYYDSPILGQELYVLLDILQSKFHFASIIKKPILHSIFEVDEEIEVMVPSINSLAGDKLTAFAPRTIGILYDTGKSMEIIKQMFDLGILFEHISNIREIHDSYLEIAEMESQYRRIDKPVDVFLEDSIETAFLLCQSGFRGSVGNDNTAELKDGIRRIKSHVFGGKYSMLQAKADASKVACLASLVRNERLNVDIVSLRKGRDDLKLIKEVNLEDEHAILNKLKRISPESFYLWAIVCGLI